MPVHTLRLVDKFVSGDPRGGGVPGYSEAGVPLIRNTEVPRAKHAHCRKQGKTAQLTQANGRAVSVAVYQRGDDWILVYNDI